MTAVAVGGVEDGGLAPASLAVTVVSVEELPKMDTFGSCDTYVKIRIGNAALQTQIVTAGEVLSTKIPAFLVQKYLAFATLRSTHRSSLLERCSICVLYVLYW